MKTLQTRLQETMALVKLRRSGQITLTAELRKHFNLDEGDYLEAEAVREGILLKPVSIMGREQAWKQIEAATDTVEDLQPHPNQSSEEKEQEIAEMVKRSRTKHAR